MDKFISITVLGLTLNSITNAQISKDGCQTISGKKCIFPFTYEGEIYYGCTDHDIPNRGWCKISSSAWSLCNQMTCASRPPKPKESNCETYSRFGKKCIFPFTYRGVEYNECTKADSPNWSWCSTGWDGTKITSYDYCRRKNCFANVGPTNKCQCGVKFESRNRIYGGFNASPNEYPWHAKLIIRSQGKPSRCGGTLISDRHVITAAHCVDNGVLSSNILVLLKEHDKNDQNRPIGVGVSNIKLHDEWRGNISSGYDYAILSLASVIDFTDLTDDIAPACLPETTNFPIYYGELATTIGWGRLLNSSGAFPDILQETKVPIISRSRCMQMYRGRITHNMLCAGDATDNVCRGDSGGGLFVKRKNSYYLVGSVSSGPVCADGMGPSIFARVTSQLGWILRNTPNSKTCPPKI